MDIDSPSSGPESTDWGIESTDEESRNSQNEDKIENASPEGKDAESSKTESDIGTENKAMAISNANVYSEVMNNKMYDTHENLL